MSNNKFNQGYACAVATLIRMHGGVETSTKELFAAGFGKYDIKKLRSSGVDEYDIETFKTHRKELI